MLKNRHRIFVRQPYE